MIIKKPCTNFGVGRLGYKPEIIVLHIMDGSLVGTDSWFANPASQVSAHYGIGFNGEVHQYIQESDTAWAQGRVDKPTFKLNKPGINPNVYCLSIEHEGKDLALAPDSQINASVELIRTLARTWSIPLDRNHIIGHYEIFSLKPNCPAVDKSIIDKILLKAQGATVPLPLTDKQKIAEAIKILQSI